MGKIIDVVKLVFGLLLLVAFLHRQGCLDIKSFVQEEPSNYYAAWYAKSGYLTCKNFEYNLAGPGGDGGLANCNWYCSKMEAKGVSCQCVKGRATHADCPRFQ